MCDRNAIPEQQFHGNRSEKVTLHSCRLPEAYRAGTDQPNCAYEPWLAPTERFALRKCSAESAEFPTVAKYSESN